VEYGKLIGAAYRVALHNWRLWPFGVFAGTGGFGFNFSYDTGGSDDPDYPGDDPIDPDLVIVLVLVALLLVLFGLAMSAISQGALAEGVAAIDRGEERGFRQALRAGLAAFWRTVGLYLLAALVALALVLAVAIPAGGSVLAVFAATDSTAPRVAVAVLAGLAALAALVVLLLPLLLIYQHAVRELVLGGARPVAALRGGWRVFRANLGPSILVFLIQQGLVLAGYAGIAIVAVVVSLPAIVVLVATGGGAAGIVVAAVTALIVLPTVLAAAGAVGTFGHGLWTLGYLRMRSPETRSRA